MPGPASFILHDVRPKNQGFCNNFYIFFYKIFNVLAQNVIQKAKFWGILPFSVGTGLFSSHKNAPKSRLRRRKRNFFGTSENGLTF